MQNSTLQMVLAEIETADDVQLSDILQALIKRRTVLHPDWELLLLSLPCSDTQERKKQLEEMFAFLQEHGS